MPQDCDAFGRMRAEQFIGRVSDGIPQLVAQVRQIIVAHSPTPIERVGGAVLEYRLVYFDWPRAGDRVAVHSGLAGVDHRTQRIVHWLLDPETGKPWATSTAVAGTMDLDTRKLIPISPAAQSALKVLAIDGLTL
jgi:acyl-CoA thioester hydrolase